MSQTRSHPVIEGTVAPGFESVRNLYEHNMRTLEEKNTQLCVYVGDEKVVDLWASATGDPDFTADSRVNVFSSGKSLEAIALAHLVDKGLLDYEARIVDYWPEFGGGGKEALTVADLMRHEAGLAGLLSSFEPKDLHADNIRQNSVGRVIEAHPSRFPKGNAGRREYHAITRGWIVNELFRRVDPQSRTIGEFLRADVCGPLGADPVIGVREDEWPSVAAVSLLPFGFQFLQSLRPAFMGRRTEKHLFSIAGRFLPMLPRMRSSTTAGGPPPIRGMKGVGVFNDPVVAMGETPSANAHSSARGLARVAAMMASGGTWGGTEYLSEKAWRLMHAEPVRAAMMSFETTFTQGGVAFFPETQDGAAPMDRAVNHGRHGFYGWFGLGGSIFQWHPEHRIGFGYVPTSLHVLDFVNERGKAYQAEVLACVTRLKGA